jgi:hypothetical protein
MDEAARIPALLSEVTTAEKGLLWALWHQTEAALTALQELESGDLLGLASRSILGEARALAESPVDGLPNTLIERLNKGEADLLLDVVRQPGAPAPPGECARALRRRRYERERAEVQREINRLQELGAAGHDREIEGLWARKKDLLQRLDALNM